MNKYKITAIEHPQYPWLHRIQALIDVNEKVPKGTIGGFVDSITNLSQGGGCWIYDDAICCEGGLVREEAEIYDDSMVRGTAVVAGKARIYNHAVANQRSWTHWMAEWLYDVRKACKKGAPICLFIDWRQYPSITDALQWAGWIWRGTAVWDKGNSRPQKGRFRQQAEYIVWGSNGPMPINRPVSCLPGVFRYGNPQNRIHVTEKPLQLMKDVIQICEPGGLILDPFAGAGTTVLAAAMTGYRAVGIEVTDAYYKLGSDRVKFALEAEENEDEK